MNEKPLINTPIGENYIDFLKENYHPTKAKSGESYDSTLTYITLERTFFSNQKILNMIIEEGLDVIGFLMMLLAYYIAAINIEETFHDLTKNKEYVPFEGIVLTDTFALSESVQSESGTVSAANMMFSTNSARATKQLETPITVIIGNPPYSVGQKSGNDNNQNVSYPYLDKSLANLL